VRLDQSFAVGAVVPAVAQAQLFAAGDGGGDRGQVLGVDRRAPPGEQRLGGPAQRADPAAQSGWQHLFELGQRPYRGLVDAGHRVSGRGAQADGDRRRFLVVEQEGRHGLAGDQPVPADRAHRRPHRVAQVAQSLHVAADGARADAEPGGQFAAGPLAGGLQQRQQAQQPGGGVGHDPRVPAMCDRI
jgi:hypothetical protein